MGVEQSVQCELSRVTSVTQERRRRSKWSGIDETILHKERKKRETRNQADYIP
jgi:hypothetical protein